MSTSPRPRPVRRILLATGALLAVATAMPVAADRFDVSDPTYQEECGSCHVPYPRRGLSDRDWSAVLEGLESHFGVDASVDPNVRTELARYLRAEPTGASGTAERTQPRLTDTRWFRHEHDEIRAEVWKRDAIRSRSNCGACHVDAAKGDYRERSVRIPR